MSGQPDDLTHFGDQTVPLRDKQGRVNEVFRRVARRYDLMNDLMSGGLHRAWKNAMVAALNPPRRRPFAVVDVAGGNAEALPLADTSHDGYTIAFGIRNVPRIAAALAEAYRVLRRGGRFLCLEFSKADVPGLDRLYDLYSFNVIPRLGELVTGDGESYRYLVESIRRFPPPAAFARRIADAGFKRVTHTPLTGGIVAIHSGWKL